MLTCKPPASVIATLALFGSCLCSAFADDAKAIYKQTARATVAVYDSQGHCLGTGSLIDRELKLIVTNEHVVNAWGINRERLEAIFPIIKDGEVVGDIKAYADLPRLRGRVVDIDAARDLAIIQLLDPLPEGTPAIKLAAKSAEPADRLHEVGHPSAGDAYWIYSSGTVRQVFHYEWHHFNKERRVDRSAKTLRTQSPTNPGDSGGPVVNDKGELIGVHSSSGSGMPAGNGSTVQLMAIHIDVSEVRPFLQQARRLLEPKTQADHLLVAERLVKREKWDDAITTLTKIIKEDPKCAAAYRVRGQAFYEKKDYDTALVDLDEAVKLDAKDAFAHYFRGASHYNQGDAEKALSDFNRAIALDPKYADAINDRGLIYYDKGEYRKALAEFSRAIELNPKEAVHWSNRGDAYYHLKDYDKSIADCNRAIGVNPHNAPGWKIRGYCLRALKLYDEQIKNFQQAVKNVPENPDAWCWLGDAFTARYQWDNAIASYSKAVELDKEHTYGYWCRGWTFEEADRIALAQADYKKALELDPDEYKPKLKTYSSATLRIFNDTDETIRVYVQYEYQTKDGQWVWYPKDPAKGTTWKFNPGERAKLDDEGWTVHCRRYRIWAVSLTSKATWDQAKDKIWVVCPEDGYLARSRPVFTHRFHK